MGETRIFKKFSRRFAANVLLRRKYLAPHGGQIQRAEGLYTEAERHAITVVGNVVAAAAAGRDTTEITRIARIGGTEPPKGYIPSTVVRLFGA